MFIEQIIAFELRGPGPFKTFTHTCTPSTGYFYSKTKMSKKNL